MLTTAFFTVLLLALGNVLALRYSRLLKPTVLTFSRLDMAKVVITVDGKNIECSESTVNLRKKLMENKIDVYNLKGKLNNCGGAGICGTCAVKVLSGANNLSPPSKNELNTLNGKPSDIRLSCCAKVSGPVSIKVKP